MSRARVLVASSSTFSMWAAYLGRMPVVWRSGTVVHRIYGDEGAEAEVGPEGVIPSGFLAHAGRALAGARDRECP
jgi:hypothetical protein